MALAWWVGGWHVAWRKGKWPFLALMVVLAVFTHGLWNALALVAGLGSELVIGVELNLGQQILNYLPLLFLLLVQLLVLLLINRRLRKVQVATESVTLDQDELEALSANN